MSGTQGAPQWVLCMATMSAVGKSDGRSAFVGADPLRITVYETGESPYYPLKNSVRTVWIIAK